MQANPKVQERPDVSAAERTSHELVMRILKLRWMGMENETESDAGRAASRRSAMHLAGGLVRCGLGRTRS